MFSLFSCQVSVIFAKQRENKDVLCDFIETVVFVISDLGRVFCINNKRKTQLKHMKRIESDLC